MVQCDLWSILLVFGILAIVEWGVGLGLGPSMTPFWLLTMIQQHPTHLEADIVNYDTSPIHDLCSDSRARSWVQMQLIVHTCVVSSSLSQNTIYVYSDKGKHAKKVVQWRGGKCGRTKYGSVVVRRKKDQVMWRQGDSCNWNKSDDKWVMMQMVHSLNAELKNAWWLQFGGSYVR
jgi:hypothetical protein